VGNGPRPGTCAMKAPQPFFRLSGRQTGRPGSEGSGSEAASGMKKFRSTPMGGHGASLQGTPAFESLAADVFRDADEKACAGRGSPLGAQDRRARRAPA